MEKPIMILMMTLMIASLVYVVVGISMHAKVSVEEDKFHDLQADYFSNNKATRDGADLNSPLTKQLVEIQNFPSELMKLKLLGLGKILTGIYLAIFAILMALLMMPIKLGKIIKGKK